MATLTQKERLAAVEARIHGHGREHELNDRVWTAKLDAIDARIRGVERILLETRLPPAAAQDAPRRLSRRDVGVISSSAAITSLAWWLAALAQRVVAG
jgi:hypothetical protein